MEKNNIKKIQNLYSNLTYLDAYGGSVLFFVILTILVFLVVSYCYIKTHIAPIKKNWVTERCKPYIIPFAGMINKPDNMTYAEYTSQNFTYCAQTVLKDISSFAVEPLTFIVAGLDAASTIITQDLQSIREMFYKYRDNLRNALENMLNQIMNLIIPLQLIIIKFGDMTAKVQGSMTAGLYTLIGGYISFQVFLDIMAYGMSVTLIIISVLLGFIPIPISFVFLILYIALLIPLSVVIETLKDEFGATIDWQLPPPPPVAPSSSCFDKNTVMKMHDGSEKKIEDIEVGDILINNNIVTAKMKLSASEINMYNFNNVIVSGSHSVKINNRWVKIADHSECEKIANYKEAYIYCLNTERKEIEINNCIFCDWDEIFEDDIDTIKIIHKTNKYKTNNEGQKDFYNSYIHKYFDGGFIGDTKVTLMDGIKKDIKDIKINDILKNGEKVYGIVEIDGSTVDGQYRYNLGKLNTQFIGGPNLNLCDKNVKFTTTIHLDEKINMDMKEYKLYHLLTDKKSFYINNVRFYDYNASIELLLEKYKGKLLSMKYV
jgi:hypothetical protein